MPMILLGKKNSAWRLFDDKNLSEGDDIELREFGAQNAFATARITKVVEKKFSQLTKTDKEGHEAYGSDQEMYDTYSGYYDTEVGPDTYVKLIWFELTSNK